MKDAQEQMRNYLQEKIENRRKKSVVSSQNQEERDIRLPVYLNPLIFRREVVICLTIKRSGLYSRFTILQKVIAGTLTSCYLRRLEVIAGTLADNSFLLQISCRQFSLI